MLFSPSYPQLAACFNSPRCFRYNSLVASATLPSGLTAARGWLGDTRSRVMALLQSRKGRSGVLRRVGYPEVWR